MKHIHSKIVPVLLVLAMVAGGAILWAQDGDGEGNDERRGGDRADRQVDREQMRERRAAMAERMREHLGVDEQEWGAIEPLINEVRTLQQAQGSARRGFAGRGGRGGRGGFGPDAEDDARELSPVQQTRRDLGETLRDENATEADIQEKLEALRSAREQHEQQLEQARQELREVLTPRQEAQLVIAGVLE